MRLNPAIQFVSTRSLTAAAAAALKFVSPSPASLDRLSVKWAFRKLLLPVLILGQGLIASLGVALPAAAQITQQTIFTTQTPTLVNQNDNTAYELGTAFQSVAAGNVTALRYWRASLDPGPHIGNLWDASGNKLASVTFVGETASGWQQQSLSTPVAIQANTTYVVSVNTPSYYVATPAGLATAVVNGDLSTVVGNNGVFATTAGVFPTGSFNNTNYFRDVAFTATNTGGSSCINLVKEVSVDGGKTFQVSTNLNSVPTETAGIPAQYEFIVQNCGTVPLKNLLVDDCVAITVTGVPNGPPYSNCHYPELIPSTWPTGIPNTLAAGASVTLTKAQIPGLGTDLCTGQPAGTIIQNNGEADGMANGAAVSFDTFALVRCPGGNHVATVSVIPSCNGYTIELTAAGLVPGTSYTINWTISGYPTTITDSITFTAMSATYDSGRITRTVGPVTGTFSFSGSATLQGFNTVPISFSPTSINCPGTSVCNALGAAAHYAALGLQGSTMNLSSGPLRFTGNVGIGQSGIFNFSGGGQVSGVLDADNTAQVNISGGGTTVQGGVVRMPMSSVQNAALAEAAAVAKLTPTQRFSQIVSTQTIVGNGGQNVISVTGTLHLSGGNTLTISGGASDTFIFIIAGPMQLDGGSNIVLSGVMPSQVLFYFPTSMSWSLQTSGNANTAGVFLAPYGGIQINGGVHNDVFISGTNLSFQSNPIVNQSCP
jgi:hypothetical protein